jgi:hypothetical protein
VGKIFRCRTQQQETVEDWDAGYFRKKGDPEQYMKLGLVVKSLLDGK